MSSSTSSASPIPSPSVSGQLTPNVTITFWFAVVKLPCISVKVQVTIVVPTTVIGKLVVVVPVIITDPHPSIVVGAIGVASHSEVISPNIGVIGAVVSSIFIVWIAVSALPHSSVIV